MIREALRTARELINIGLFIAAIILCVTVWAAAEGAI